MKRLFALLFVLWCAPVFAAGMMQDIINAKPPASGGGNVTLDANATAVATGNPANSITNNNLTIGNVPNPCLVAQLNFYITGALLKPTPAAITVTSVTWNGTPMTQIVNLGNSYLFGLVNPASGNHALVASWTAVSGTQFTVLNGTSFTNCNQTTTFVNTATNNGIGTAPTISVTNPSGNIAIDLAATGNGVPGSPTQTQLYTEGTNTYSAASYSSGVNPTFLWTAPTGPWNEIGASIAHP